MRISAANIGPNRFDAAYQGPQFAQAVAKRLPGLAVEIVKRSDKAKGFEVLPMRWVVERTIAWLNRCPRLAKDVENLTDNAWWAAVAKLGDLAAIFFGLIG